MDEMERELEKEGRVSDLFFGGALVAKRYVQSGGIHKAEKQTPSV
jgi:hypothetical protein